MCHKPVDKVLCSRMNAAAHQRAMQRNAAACAGSCVRPYTPRLGSGRQCTRHVLHDVLVDTLDAMIATGGKPAKQAVKKLLPTYDVM